MNTRLNSTSAALVGERQLDHNVEGISLYPHRSSNTESEPHAYAFLDLELDRPVVPDSPLND